MKTICTMIFFSVISLACHAGLISNDPNPSVQYQQKKFSFIKKGKGIRKKKIAFVSISAYEAQLYVSEKSSISYANPQLENRQQQLALELTFLRSIDSEKIMNAYLDSLKVNKVNTEQATIKQFLNVVKSSGEVNEKNKITIVGIPLDNGNDLILYEDQNNKMTEIVGKDLVRDIFSIWLGKSSDEQLEQLKKELLK